MRALLQAVVSGCTAAWCDRQITPDFDRPQSAGPPIGRTDRPLSRTCCASPWTEREGLLAMW